MKKLKRSAVEPGRLQDLKREHAVYTIACATPDCPCGRQNPGCERGFFSLFIQVIYGIDFSTRMGIPYHVDFGNDRYCYTDDQFKERNFWNYYFLQPLPVLSGQHVPVLNQFNELYPLLIWSRSHLRRMHKHVRALSFKEEVFQHLKLALVPFKNKRVLGVHIRRTDHPEGVAPVRLERYYQLIRHHLPSYDKVFLTTDDARVAETLRDLCQEKLIINTATRSADQLPVHRNPELTNRWKLGLDVLKDCYALAHCDMAILAHSNVSYAALLFNPELPYILPERLSTRWKRIKTLSVFYLDRWGIRKW